MKITIIQAEIHQAIESYIRSQITVNEGMKIEINLRATRGEEGSTAEIDIVPDVPEPAPEPVKATRAPRQPRQVESKPLNIASKVQEAKAEPIPDDPKAEPAVDQGEAPVEAPVEEEPAEGTQEALAAEALATEPVEAAEAETTSEATEAAPVRQSLFSGLNKPVNK